MDFLKNTELDFQEEKQWTDFLKGKTSRPHYKYAAPRRRRLVDINKYAYNKKG